MREIVLTPNYENTLAYMASAIADGSVEKAGRREFIVSVMEQAAYLAQTDKAAFMRVLERVGKGGR